MPMKVSTMDYSVPKGEREGKKDKKKKLIINTISKKDLYNIT